MYLARKPLVRSTCVVAAAAFSFVLSSGIAQERSSRVETAAVGQPAPVLNPRHPESYVVQRGDTLWDIASMFLRDPWLWPEIWQINQQVENPHLIFPGDILSLAYLDDGRPVMRRDGVGEAQGQFGVRPAADRDQHPLDVHRAALLDDGDVARRLADDLVDRRREDHRPAPAVAVGRRLPAPAEDDEVGLLFRGGLDDALGGVPADADDGVDGRPVGCVVEDLLEQPPGMPGTSYTGSEVHGASRGLHYPASGRH